MQSKIIEYTENKNERKALVGFKRILNKLRKYPHRRNGNQRENKKLFGCEIAC